MTAPEGRLAVAALDALSSHIATLDDDGTIISVNEAWRQFAMMNGADWRAVGPGANYLAVCDRVRMSATDVADAEHVSRGIRDVLAGHTSLFVYGYACHSPSDKRWFYMRVTPIRHAEASVLVAHLDITSQRLAEDAHASAVRLFEAVFEFAPDALVLCSDRGVITRVNRQAEIVFGYPRDELVGAPIETLVPQERRAVHIEQRRAYVTRPETRSMGGQRSELRALRRDGSQFDAEISLAPIETAEGHMVVAAIRDATERRALENHARQSQKMETVGRLAGGIAHDFNNLLSVIGTSAEFALQELPEGAASVREDIAAIQSAASRAAALTQQLLTFSRRQILRPTVVDLNALVSSLEPILRRLIGSHVHIDVRLGEHLLPIRADPVQIEQVLLNLALNARDAMPTGGTLTIQTANTPADELVHLRSPEGAVPSVMLSVYDTGVGMDESTRSHLFEPFFTTKELGKGTGLGLATVYGIVSQYGGDIRCESQVGSGTAFFIRLPATDIDAVPAPSHTLRSTAGPHGTETILLIEDEDELRAITARALSRWGYRVLSAASGNEALRLLADHPGPLDLVVSDLVMPGLNGWEVAAEIRQRHGEVEVVFTSGYADEAFVRHKMDEFKGRFLPKPYSLEDLARTVRRVLDEAAAGPPEDGA